VADTLAEGGSSPFFFLLLAGDLLSKGAWGSTIVLPFSFRAYIFRTSLSASAVLTPAASLSDYPSERGY